MDLFPPETIDLPGGPARVAWRRSDRARRISLRIDPRQGAVVVTLPPRAGRRAGLALLTMHATWVTDRLAALPGAVRIGIGAQIPVDGIPHEIRPGGARRGGVWLEDGALFVRGEEAFIARRVGDFLRAEAKRRMTSLAIDKAHRAGLAVRRVQIKDTRSRWGSCSSTGVLAFSWRLVMAPGFVQDYVAGHEVAHLRHMHHQPEFWRLVAELTPHTDAAVTWLREQGPSLLRVG